MAGHSGIYILGITCRAMMTLPVGNRLKLLTDDSGLDRMIRWTHYVEEPGYLKFLRGGELVLTTGMLLGSTGMMVDFVQSLNNKGCAGMVLSTDMPLSNLPYVNHLINVANSLNFSLFLLPWEIGMVELCQVICKEIVECEMSKNSLETFMNYLLYNDVPLDGKNINAAKAFGYMEGKSYVSAVISVARLTSTIEGNGERNIIQILTRDVYRKARERGCTSILHVVKGNKVILMLIEFQEKANAIGRLMVDVVKENFHKDPCLKISVGIGPAWVDLNKFKRSAQIAEKLADKTGNEGVLDFSQLDLERLLYGEDIDTGEIAEVVNSIFVNLNGCGENSRDELKRILKVYIKNMCSLTETAQELFMHVNTLRYKINKIEECCGCDIKNSETYFKFCLGFRLEEFINALDSPRI